jgi:hypothetical protein
MISLVAMGWIHLVVVLVVMIIHEICLNLNSGSRIIHKFSNKSQCPTFELSNSAPTFSKSSRIIYNQKF